MTQRVILLRGLPGSGKTTYARRLTVEQDFRRISRDDLRHMLGPYHRPDELLVTHIECVAIREALRAGDSIVIDACNMFPEQLQQIELAVASFNIPIEIKFLDVPLAECLRRNAARQGDDRVPDRVIKNMHKEWLSKQ